MATPTTSFLFTNARVQFLTGTIDWSSDNIAATLVDCSSFTPTATMIYYSEVSTATTAPVVKTATTYLASKGTTAGYGSSTDVSFGTVTGVSAEGIIAWKDTGSASTSPLLLFLTTTGITGFPTPSGFGGTVNFRPLNGNWLYL